MNIEPSNTARQTQPPSGSNPFQIALSDLLIITFGMGALMTLWRNAQEDSFYPAGVVVIGLTGILGMYCLFIAARRGISSRLLRWAYAVGAIMQGVGLVFFCVAFIYLFVLRFASERIFWGSVLLASISFVMLLAGPMLHGWVLRKHKEGL